MSEENRRLIKQLNNDLDAQRTTYEPILRRDRDLEQKFDSLTGAVKDRLEKIDEGQSAVPEQKRL